MTKLTGKVVDASRGAVAGPEPRRFLIPCSAGRAIRGEGKKTNNNVRRLD